MPHTYVDSVSLADGTKIHQRHADMFDTGWTSISYTPTGSRAKGSRIAWPRTELSAFDDLNRFVLAGRGSTRYAGGALVVRERGGGSNVR
jgi:hypothetical protein